MNPIHKDRRVSYSFLMVLVFMGSGCGSPVSAQSLTIHPSAYVRPSQYTDCIPDVSSFLYYTDSRNLGKEDRDLGMKAAKSRAEELCADPNFAADFKNILACSQNINLGKGYYGNSEDFLNYCKDEESQKNAKAVGACRSQMFWAMNNITFTQYREFSSSMGERKVELPRLDGLLFDRIGNGLFIDACIAKGRSLTEEENSCFYILNAFNHTIQREVRLELETELSKNTGEVYKSLVFENATKNVVHLLNRKCSQDKYLNPSYLSCMKALVESSEVSFSGEDRLYEISQDLTLEQGEFICNTLVQRR